MERLLLLLLVCWPSAGCGPMLAPLPVRLDEDAQSAIDLSWEKALTPVGALDHQGLLDVLIHSNAYQLGVDRLTFRSEKRYSGGTVVMEIEFQRQAPTMDRFEVSMLDLEGRAVRKESYSRQDIECSYRELHEEHAKLRAKSQQVALTPAEQERLAGLETRRQTLEAIFRSTSPNTLTRRMARAPQTEAPGRT